MPGVVKMVIHNGNNNAQRVTKNTAPVMPLKSNVNMSLASPMISRVHNQKSGCSACGKKVM